MNPRSIVSELGALSRFLDFAYLPRTAAVVRGLTPVDLRSDDRDPWFAPVLQTYREEILNSFNILGEPDPAHHQALLEGMDRLVHGAETKPNAWWGFLSRMRPVLEAIGESHGNTRELYRSFVAPGSSRKHVYLNLCLMYVILCEGVFRNQGIVLVGLHDISAGQHPDGRNLSPEELAESLHRIGIGAFAAGYHRHLRNAIAHGHFKYDPGSNEMRFRDYDYRQGRLKFDEVWPFEGFVRQYAKMDDVYLVVSTYLQVCFLPLLGARAPTMDSTAQ